ncbi:urease accessory protein UreD [Candidatus Nitrospira bockiana]
MPSPPIIPASDAGQVGRAGDISLAFVRAAGTTVLSESRACTPWHFLPPMTMDDGAAYALLVNPSGGLVGGDRLGIRVALGPETRVLCSTPSANRVYRSLGERADQVVDLEVAEGAVLEWVPDLTIPFAGSRYRQRMRVRLGAGAMLLLWDAFASGRVARGERWRFATFENEVEVSVTSGWCARERYRLDPGGAGWNVGLAEDWDYVGSLWIIGESMAEEKRKGLEDSLAAILGDRQGRVLGGVSEPAVRGLIVKFFAKSAPDFTACFEACWAAARAQLWGLPLPALRRY